MAKVTSLRVGPTLQLLNASANIDWTFFKNTPATLVSASGHNHDLVYYTTPVVNSKFATQEARIDVLVGRIEAKAIKRDLLMGGGGTVANATIHNYNHATEVSSQIATSVPFSTINSPGITSANKGYMTNSSRQVSSIDYLTRVFVAAPNCLIDIKGTMIDYAIQTKGYVSNGANGWVKFDVKVDTWETRDSCACETDGRPLLSSQVKGYSKKNGSGLSYEYSYLSSTSRTLTAFTTNGITSGLCRSSNYGYWISGINANFKHTYATDSITLFTGLTNDMSNTNVSSGEYYGVLASGNNSSIVRKLNWSTEAITVASAIIDKTGASSVEQ